jgi:predicted anti-sigma-YlaC factor YlaD
MSTRRPARRGVALVGAFLTGLLPACSLKKIAVNSLGNALSEGTSSFASDDDPELVFDATPFALKTVESLLETSPRHRGLLLTAASGFTQYAYGDLEQQADFVEASDLKRATFLRARAKKLYLRARDYGFRGLELDVPGLRAALAGDPQKALARARKRDVPLLYWTGVSWAAAISLAVNDPSLSVDQRLAEALVRRALALDEGWNLGSSHDFFITYEGARASVGGSYERATEHYRRALELSQGHRAWPMVAWAESVAVPRQDKQGFEKALEEALAVDVDAVKDQRLSNVIAERRARFLLGREDELFVE